jgi:hypothetical protein
MEHSQKSITVSNNGLGLCAHGRSCECHVVECSIKTIMGHVALNDQEERAVAKGQSPVLITRSELAKVSRIDIVCCARGLSRHLASHNRALDLHSVRFGPCIRFLASRELKIGAETLVSRSGHPPGQCITRQVNIAPVEHLFAEHAQPRATYVSDKQNAPGA